MPKNARTPCATTENHRQQVETVDEIIAAPMSAYATIAHQDNMRGDEELDAQDNSASDEGEESLPIIAELSYEVESLSVEQAVMRLELSVIAVCYSVIPGIWG